MTGKSIAAFGFVLLCGCGLWGCEAGERVRTGPLTHEAKSIDMGKYEMARIELRMGAGELSVEGNSPKLLDADFLYNVPSWKPIVESNTSSFRADVKIEQPPHAGAMGNRQYKWDLHLNNALPMNLVTNLGAGEARMDLGALNLRSLQIHMGVGSLRLDLRGNPKSDYNVEIHGGVGEATVFLPKQAGISATARGGIGDIQVEGLENRGGRWINEAYGRAPVRIHLDIAGGVGNIRLVAE
ncbi:MAG TPA: toast rack family protein [Bryobacteraceae bacterium]|nr:toast rack family protein [Bryobacteraceae bacterium]